VPVDGASTGRGGARQGPSEIRENFRLPLFGGATNAEQGAVDRDKAEATMLYLDFETRRQYPGPVPRVADLGTVLLLRGESIGTYGPRISLLTDLILDRGAVPGMLGGDHSCTAFALEPQLRRHPAMGIIHFDAHHDLWPPPARQGGIAAPGVFQVFEAGGEPIQCGLPGAFDTQGLDSMGIESGTHFCHTQANLKCDSPGSSTSRVDNLARQS
jgi:arginase family enzyme